jgi:uncharacterized protein
VSGASSVSPTPAGRDREPRGPDSIPDRAEDRAQRASVQRKRPLWLRLLRSVIVIYVGVCIGMWMLQNKLVFPGAASQGAKYAIVHPSDWYDLVPVTTRDGDKSYLVFAKAADSSHRVRDDAAFRPTLIWFYGNGESLAHALGIIRYVRSMGFNVLGVEYVGYGMASGSPSEKATYAMADAAYDYLLTRSDIDRDKIVPAGVSLGCAAAIDLASRRKVAGLVCFSPFTSLPAMARLVAPYLPTGLLLSYKFDNAGKIATYTGPLFLCHGRDDTIVPFQMSERLRQLAKGAVTFVPLEDLGHNDLFDSGEELYGKLRKFLEGL